MICSNFANVRADVFSAVHARFAFVLQALR
jgi:hypothetical protein